MRRVGRYYVLGAGVAALLAVYGDRVPEALAEVEHFRIRGVEIEGARHLSAAEVEAALGLPAGASVWDDPSSWEARLESHPLVLDARLHRRLPSTLVVRVEERVPVALVATPVLEPVDSEGRSLPVDPAVHGLDLPLIHPAAEGAGRRVLAAEAARLEASFASRISELAWEGDGDVVARLAEPTVAVRFRPPLDPARAREALMVLADAAARWPGRRVEAVDLRWADQVVVRYHGGSS